MEGGAYHVGYFPERDVGLKAGDITSIVEPVGESGLIPLHIATIPEGGIQPHTMLRLTGILRLYTIARYSIEKASTVEPNGGL